LIMEFTALVISEKEPFYYRELEEALLSIDFQVEFINELESDLSWISNSEFKYDVFFLLKEPTENELPAVSSLSKMKVMFIQPDPHFLQSKSKKSLHWLNAKGVHIDDIFYVVDDESKDGDTFITIHTDSMKNTAFFEDVGRIIAKNAYHISSRGWEVVLHGTKNTKAMAGELITRAGRDVHLVLKKDNLMVFSCDIFSNDVMRGSDNGKFLQNAVELMLKGADFVD